MIEPKRQPAPQPEREGRLGLPARHRQNPGAHDFGDEGGGIGGQRNQQRDEFRDQPDPADEVEAAQFRAREGDREAERDQRREGKRDEQSERHPADRKLLPGPGLAAHRPDPQADGRHDGEQDRGGDDFRAGFDHRLGDDQAAIVEVELGRADPFGQASAPARKRARQSVALQPRESISRSRHHRLPADPDALPRPRQGAEHGQIPEQDLEQERQVADELDITPGQSCQQPIGGQPGDADEEAEHCCEQDADCGYQQGIEQSDQEDAAIAVGFLIGDERLVDAEAGGRVEEAEPAGDALGVEIGLGVERKLPGEPQHRRSSS